MSGDGNVQGAAVAFGVALIALAAMSVLALRNCGEATRIERACFETCECPTTTTETLTPETKP